PFTDQLEAADDHDRRALGLAHDDTGSRGEVVCDREHGGVHLTPGIVGCAAQVDQARQAGHPERDVDDAQPPGTSEGVRYDDANIDTAAIADALPDSPRARIRVDGQERDDAGFGDVRLVHTRVGADETVMGLGDQHPLGSQHANALVEDDLDKARIWYGDELRGYPFGLVARFDPGEFAQPPLGLRHHLLGDHEHVRGLELRVRA